MRWVDIDGVSLFPVIELAKSKGLDPKDFTKNFIKKNEQGGSLITGLPSEVFNINGSS